MATMPPRRRVAILVNDIPPVLMTEPLKTPRNLRIVRIVLVVIATLFVGQLLLDAYDAEHADELTERSQEKRE